MGKVGMILGILAIVGMVVGFVPCLGWINWFVLVCAVIGIIMSAMNASSSKGGATAGIVLNAIAIVFGGIRLFIGGGIF